MLPISNDIAFRQQASNDSKYKKTAIGVSLAALASPLLPIIDGDSFKETYKNRNVAKYTTGLCAIGGIFTAGKFLTDEKIKQSKDPYGNRILRNAILGAVVGPLFILVENWAQTEKKNMAKKWYPIAAAAGALIGAMTAGLNRK